jgi:alkanesulfonate monooxygenase SsuD/methylene tetrahydromethanopterin reductase-like flavin-dependent oxidoreductase (luciferase family)
VRDGELIGALQSPTRVAEEFAMIDVISSGRLIAGSRSGRRWTPATPGQNPSMLRERYHEAHDLVLRA